MIRILMIILFIIVLYLFILGLYHLFNNKKDESNDVFDKSKPNEDDADINHIYNSAINFDNVSIKDRSYLNTFVDEINPDLPQMQRLNKDKVDVTSYLFNKRHNKKGE